MSDSIQVPREKLQEQRQQALQRHQKRKRRNKTTAAIASSIVILCLAFTLSIRVSPAFANYVAQIPGFAPFVAMIEEDKGMRDVLNNGYFEEIGASATSKEHHITLSVIGVVADYSGLAIAYTVEAPRNLSDFGHPNIDILHNGKQIPAGFLYDYSREEETTYIEDMIMLTSDQGLDFSSRDFELVFTYEDIGETIAVPFTLQQDIYEPKKIAENVELELQQQRLTIESIMITPMRAILKFDVDEQNDMQIIALDGLKLVDERGEEWATIRNGLFANGSLRENNYTLYMESNYYREPKSLKLMIDAVAALPKGEDYIVVDFDKQKFVKLPDAPELEFELGYHILSVSYEKGFTALGWGIDAKGNNVYDTSFTQSEHEMTQFINISEEVVSPVRFNIDYYPNYIGENIEVEL